MNRTLIFGSTGFLGKTFFTGIAPQVIPVDRRQYDFTRPIDETLVNFLRISQASYAVITSAISSPDDCVKDPEHSAAVNVKGTIELLKQLKQFKIKPVFFSSDHVFDGQKGQYDEEQAYAPITLYGRQKVASETFVRENFANYLILRTSKQVAMRVDPKNSLSEMALQLRAGRAIRCATDNWIAPSFVEDIVRLTHAALAESLTGIFNVAPDEEYSRLELGHIVADSFEVPRSKVEPCSIKDFQFAEVRPPRCTLNGRKLRDTLGMRMTSLTEGLKILKASL